MKKVTKKRIVLISIISLCAVLIIVFLSFEMYFCRLTCNIAKESSNNFGDYSISAYKDFVSQEIYSSSFFNVFGNHFDSSEAEYCVRKKYDILFSWAEISLDKVTVFYKDHWNYEMSYPDGSSSSGGGANRDFPATVTWEKADDGNWYITETYRHP